MANRTDAERELLEKAARYMPGASTGNMKVDPEHLFLIKEGRGSKVWDVSGNEYIDYLMGSGPMVLGHAHPSVVAAVKEAVEQGSTFFATNERAVLLAEEIAKAVPSADKVRFTTSGTDADFQAMRIARAFRKRDVVLKFEGGYHGTSDYAVMNVTPSASSLKEFPTPAPNTAGVPKAILDTMLIAPYNDIETAAAIIEQNHDDLAAVILEPMQRVIAPKPGFLQGLRDVTSHFEIPLIFDEVVTGFRLAYGGAQEYYGVQPDLTTMGKIVGGGYPLGAVAGREELMAVLDPQRADSDSFVSQVGTLNANPVACAAGLATLNELRKPGIYDRLHAIGRQIRDAIERVCREAEVPMQPSGEDAIFGFYFTDEPIENYRSTLKADAEKMARFNILLLDKGVLKNWPDKFYPSLAHSSEDIDTTTQAFAKVIDQIKG
ncbi:MAG: aminotransferase class III-fold pyridoxal phosphate-dependent enzyme [Dehalococcoidia bacterium]|nr:aminotransferase class III-fold pyridoxal phosphate-dependent enzyme [Dehalococcoidia bacterium]